jgi:hypothetical protein
MLTESTGVNAPKSQIAKMREDYPETRDLTASRILRFALALAVGFDRENALRVSGDPRIGAKLVNDQLVP